MIVSFGNSVLSSTASAFAAAYQTWQNDAKALVDQVKAIHGAVDVGQPAGAGQTSSLQQALSAWVAKYPLTRFCFLSRYLGPGAADALSYTQKSDDNEKTAEKARLETRLAELVFLFVEDGLFRVLARHCHPCPDLPGVPLARARKLACRRRHVHADDGWEDVLGYVLRPPARVREGKPAGTRVCLPRLGAGRWRDVRRWTPDPVPG